ncbi:substrate-binding domain-containing protein [Streptomyces sp. NPDC048623]|uniref:substrate-binding domain-containing protein n=1 Tax=Streptomyces sp. NPDC048623 TaxID=3155761 RepID=UPI0034448639
MRRSTTLSLTAALAVAGLVSSCSTPGAAGGDKPKEYKVALVTTTSGPLASYGEQYLHGFEAGLDYATGGTGKVDGVKVTVTKDDDGADPAKAVSLVKKRVGEGVQIVAGTGSSGVAVQVAPLAAQNKTLYISGPAATDAMTGVGKYVFRSGRQTYQDVMTAMQILGTVKGKKVIVVAQDNTFGQASSGAVKKILGAEGAVVQPELISPTATDFTPTASKVKAAKPDLVFVAWAGTTATALWNTLDQQGVLDSSKVVTGLDLRASYPVLGKAKDKITLLAHYVPEATDNDEAKAMRAYFKKKGWEEDLFVPDGFNAAQMVVRALKAGGAKKDTNAMIASLEDYNFLGVKGQMTVRGSDHALLQPMFQAKFGATGDMPVIEKTFSNQQVAPAEKPIG